MADVDAYSFARVVYILLCEGRNENQMPTSLQFHGDFQLSWKHGYGRTVHGLVLYGSPHPSMNNQ
jgi:hypothetical protein